MNRATLAEFLAQQTLVLHEDEERWKIEYRERPLLVVCDEEFNRLRIMAAIRKDTLLDEFDLQMLLTANFDRTLDCRYALSGGVLWAVYLHPLREATPELVHEGLRQVSNLAATYGGRYASSTLVFHGGQEADDPAEHHAELN